MFHVIILNVFTQLRFRSIMSINNQIICVLMIIVLSDRLNINTKTCKYFKIFVTEIMNEN